MPYTIKKSHHGRPPAVSFTNELITFAQFYEMVDEKTKADLLDGVVIRDSPAVPQHARLVSWLNKVIGVYAERFDLGEVLGATATVRLSAYNAPEPDVFFIVKSQSGIIKEKFVDGPPDLCIEVVSRSSRKYDRGRKFVLYAEHGVKEYWIIDPLRHEVEFFENLAGEFIPIKPDEGKRLHSKILPGFWLKPEWLAADPLPAALTVLQEILGPQQFLIEKSA